MNPLLAPCADGQRVFRSDAGQLSTAIAYDQLHLSPLGYGVLGGAMEEPIRRILGGR